MGIKEFRIYVSFFFFLFKNKTNKQTKTKTKLPMFYLSIELKNTGLRIFHIMVDVSKFNSGNIFLKQNFDFEICLRLNKRVTL